MSKITTYDIKMGNYFQFGDEFCPVFEINELAFYVSSESFGSLKNTATDIKPITLDENLMIKNLGFTKVENGVFIKDDKWVVIFLMGDRCSFNLKRSKYNVEWLRDFNYLHELQNIYEYNSTKVLEIKLTKEKRDRYV